MAYLKDVNQLQAEVTVVLQQMAVEDKTIARINGLFENQQPTVDAVITALGTPMALIHPHKTSSYHYCKTPLPLNSDYTYYRVSGSEGVDHHRNVWLMGVEDTRVSVVKTLVQRATRKVGLRHLHQSGLDAVLIYYPPDSVLENLLPVDIQTAPPGIYFERSLDDWQHGWAFRPVIIYPQLHPGR